MSSSEPRVQPSLLPRPIASIALACGLSLPAAAQQVITPGVNPTQPGAGLQQQGQPNAPGQGGLQGAPDDEFAPIWMVQRARSFSGFPVFPSRLKGYGNYPLPVAPDNTGGAIPGQLPTTAPLDLGGAQVPVPLAPLEPEPPDWPSWVRNQAKVSLPFSPEVALLVGNNERVWWRSNDDEPMVPLFFYSKFATLPVGGAVEVRRSGEFELQLHTSTRIEARGPTAVRMLAMDEGRVHVEVSRLTWMRIQANERTQHVTLPDGSLLVIDAPADPAAGNPFAALLGGAAPAPTPGLAQVELRRLDEPGWFGGRATMTNLGGRDVTWQHAHGTVTLAPSQRVTLFLTPAPDPATPAALQAGNAEVERRDGTVVCRSAASQEVAWCGAGVQLPPGGEVVFESLQGDAFTPTAPSTKDPAGAAAATRPGG